MYDMLATQSSEPPSRDDCIALETPRAIAVLVKCAPGTGELEDARWFTRAEALAMLEASTAPPPRGGGGGGAAAAEPALRTPPPFAIAHHLIRRWAQEAGSSL